MSDNQNINLRAWDLKHHMKLICTVTGVTDWKEANKIFRELWSDHYSHLIEYPPYPMEDHPDYFNRLWDILEDEIESKGLYHLGATYYTTRQLREELHWTVSLIKKFLPYPDHVFKIDPYRKANLYSQDRVQKIMETEAYQIARSKRSKRTQKNLLPHSHIL